MPSHAFPDHAAASAPWIRRAINIAVVAIVVLAGCAPAYHCYDDCCVPCQYCPPAPLPYTGYCDCQCHSKAAQPYLASSTEALVNPASTLQHQTAPRPDNP